MENENDYNQELKRKHPRVTIQDDDDDELEEAMILQRLRADALREVDDEIAARQRVDENILKIFYSDNVPREPDHDV